MDKTGKPPVTKFLYPDVPVLNDFSIGQNNDIYNDNDILIYQNNDIAAVSHPVQWLMRQGKAEDWGEEGNLGVKTQGKNPVMSKTECFWCI